MHKKGDYKIEYGQGKENAHKNFIHFAKGDHEAIKKYVNLGGDITELLSKRFSLKRSRKVEEELKLKLKLAEKEILELKATISVIESKTKVNSDVKEDNKSGILSSYNFITYTII